MHVRLRIKGLLARVKASLFRALSLGSGVQDSWVGVSSYTVGMFQVPCRTRTPLGNTVVQRIMWPRLGSL